MSQWKLVANASTNTSGPVQWVGSSLQQGSGNANQQSNNLTLVANDTPGSLRTAPYFSGNGTNQVSQNKAVGQFAFTAASYANGAANTTSNASFTGETRKVPGGTGWVVRTAGEGPINGLTASNGSGFANGETAVLSGGSANGLAVLTANATGNLASAVASSGGLFTNASSLSVTFNREEHVVKITLGANTNAFTNLPAANAAVSVTVSNTGNSFATAGQPAVGYFQTNVASGITNTILNTISWTAASGNTFANSSVGAGFAGLFSNNQPNTAVVITFNIAANGLVVNAGGGALVANLATSTGGVVAASALGGRAGRVRYETLVSTKFIANGALANSTHSSVYFPQ